MLVWTYLLTAALSADPTIMPLLATLPEDGRWAKYDLRMQVNSDDHLLTWTVSSVGQFQQAGKDVRCIETELLGGRDVSPICHRLLVPNDAFGPDKHALGQVVRVWIRLGADPVKSYNDLSGDPPTAMFLAGITQNLKRQDQKETVNWPRGKFECTVYTGKSVQDIGPLKYNTDWTILRHNDLPFGLAGLRMKLVPEGQGDAMNITLTLQDYGKMRRQRCQSTRRDHDGMIATWSHQECGRSSRRR